MKNKNKTIGILLLALALSVLVYLYLKNKNDNPKLELSPLKDNSGNPVKENNHVVIITAPVGNFPLQKGSKGKAVQMLQVLVGAKPDGIWGNATEVAINTKLKDNNITKPEFIALVTPTEKNTDFPLTVGKKNNYIKALQIIYGLKIDGVFGSATIAAVKMPFVTIDDYNTKINNFLNS